MNWYPERTPAPAPTQEWALYPTPGVELKATATSGPGRAHFFLDNREFAVIGAQLVEIDINYNLTVRGTVAVDDNPATISGNGDGGDQLFITSGSNGYSYNLSTNTLSAVASMAGKATMGEFMDGYFFALDTATSTVYNSDLFDGTTWDTTNGQQRSLAADPWVSLKRNGTFLYILGTETSEVWFNAGNATFPLAPHPSGLIQRGIKAPFSLALGESALLWLDQTRNGFGSVQQCSGFTPETVSNVALQSLWDTYPITDDAVGEVYQDQGHTFYLLNFPRADVTWCYDMTTGMWHERGTWIAEESRYTVWRPRYHVLAFGEHRWLDSRSGGVYKSSISTTTDVDSRPIRRLRRPPAISQENQRIYVSNLEIEVEPGQGAVSGQGENPQLMLRWSNDGGFNFGTERLAGVGKIGAYGKRCRWTRNGMGRRRVAEITCTDPIPWKILNAYIQVSNASVLEAMTGVPKRG